ncbi:SUF system NifU family Fe-S cluster assembly protein [Ectothiorhodospiraceae bacterium WFHF3C12]|nr:SUF system NifU family Fe-S cluster assembly protein [Ectothiorhodospiraceae bacterium WFHF3C12]
MTTASELYKGVMMDHYHAPRNQGSPGSDQVTARVHNPLCGDDLELGVTLADERIQDIRFRARGCSICIASGSMMTEVVSGRQVAEALDLDRLMNEWFSGEATEPPSGLPEPLPALGPVRHYPSRTRCVLLAWEALEAVLDRGD